MGHRVCLAQAALDRTGQRRQDLRREHGGPQGLHPRPDNPSEALMATQNEKIARKTLVVQEVMNNISSTRFFEDWDAEQFQLDLIERGYLIVSL